MGNSKSSYLMDNYKEVYFDAISKIKSKSDHLYEQINDILSVFYIFKNMTVEECREMFVVINKQNPLRFTDVVYPIKQIPKKYDTNFQKNSNYVYEQYNLNNNIKNKNYNYNVLLCKFFLS